MCKENSLCIPDRKENKLLNKVVIFVFTKKSMQGQKALRFHHKYLNLCSEAEQRSYGFVRVFIFELNELSL